MVGKSVYRRLQDYEKEVIGNFYMKYKRPYSKYAFIGDLRVFNEDLVVKENDYDPSQHN
jgi:hypothetical protein